MCWPTIIHAQVTAVSQSKNDCVTTQMDRRANLKCHAIVTTAPSARDRPTSKFFLEIDSVFSKKIIYNSNYENETHEDRRFYFD